MKLILVVIRALSGLLLVTAAATAHAGETWYAIRFAQSRITPPRAVQQPYLTQEDLIRLKANDCVGKALAYTLSEKTLIGSDNRPVVVLAAVASADLIDALDRKPPPKTSGRREGTWIFASTLKRLGVAAKPAPKSVQQRIQLQPVPQQPAGPRYVDETVPLSGVLDQDPAWFAELSRIGMIQVGQPLPAAPTVLRGADRMAYAVPATVLLRVDDPQRCERVVDGLVDELNRRARSPIFVKQTLTLQ